ncbi:LysR family transcriptional regulator [Castellaniella denitrificans]|uniref:LysR family transcriptional regulator n=1 Tax=Castellaniella denitrificans TaxID=56119 RepID=A0ABT4M052_9BURK|nr:LysR family transcriptional regulator [Castellaniella denitrificans]MCZ4328697.1 LysR family transcriptional regulator [Castellaniella denitrificans]
MSEPDFNLLVALDALLAEGSVAGAARRTGLSTSAMSRTLGRLRATTGDPLLVRAGRQMVPTPHAQAIRERARDAVLEIRTLLSPAVSELDPSTLDRIFVIRANEGFVEAFGPGLIAAAASEAPRVSLHFAPKMEKDSRYLREGRVDLEIGVVENMGPEIRLQALFRDHFIGVVRAGHPLLSSPAVTAGQYASYGHVVASRRGRAHGPVDDALAELGLARKVASVVPGFPAALAVAMASDLIALLPASYLPAPPAGGKAGQAFGTFELPVPTQVITISQMWHPRLEMDPAHRWLRQLVRRTCGEGRADGD